jgi:hypothetical protein
VALAWKLDGAVAVKNSFCWIYGQSNGQFASRWNSQTELRIRRGEIEKARRELEIAIALNPDQTNQLRQWFGQLSKERKK